MPLYIIVGPDGMRRKCSTASANELLPLDPNDHSQRGTLDPDETLVTLKQYAAEPDGQTHTWNPATLDFELIPPPPPPAPVTAMSRGAFMQRLRAAQGIGARALEFVILTAARSGEARGIADRPT